VIIQATHYGTLALVIIAGALGILILTLATRAFRRARRKTHRVPQDSDQARPDAGQGPQDGEAAKRDWPDAPGEADTVVTDRFTVGHDAAHASDHDPAEETDDYAWAPGRADPR
jgi:hypothetical protein